MALQRCLTEQRFIGLCNEDKDRRGAYVVTGERPTLVEACRDERRGSLGILLVS